MRRFVERRIVQSHNFHQHQSTQSRTDWPKCRHLSTQFRRMCDTSATHSSRSHFPTFRTRLMSDSTAVRKRSRPESRCRTIFLLAAAWLTPPGALALARHWLRAVQDSPAGYPQTPRTNGGTGTTTTMRSLRQIRNGWRYPVLRKRPSKRATKSGERSRTQSSHVIAFEAQLFTEELRGSTSGPAPKRIFHSARNR